MEKGLHLLTSFIAAFGALFSIFPSTQSNEVAEIERLRNYYATRSDAEMIAHDFSVIGSDIAKSMRSL
ncbi:MAG: hypothetical protein IK079_06500 [Desulfovibrio sp.]|nr:hypothetical protein [Desulfovibrio sp.]